MKKRLCTLMILISSSICYAQKNITVPNAQTNVTVDVRLRPFLGSKNLTVIGDLKTGTVKISMDLWNHFNSTLSGVINLEAFNNFGLTDDRGYMYEFSLVRTDANTKGIKINYSAIEGFKYRSKSVGHQRTLKFSIPPRKGHKFSFLLLKVDRKVKAIRELHCKYSVLFGKGYINYTKNVENFKIRWR